MPDNPLRDFRTRRASPRERMLSFGKKISVLALAIAIPAIAANNTIMGEDAESAEPVITRMPFEMPGENFPGSAFFYLEETPQLVDAEGWSAPVEIIGSSPAFATGDDSSDGELTSLPLAANPLRITGSDRDHRRAQECMAQAIYYEAASESDAGQRAVAQVVLNRLAHRAYPDTVCGVVYQGSERQTGCQFSFTCDGALNRKPSTSEWRRAGRHAREALAGIVYAPVGTATHYHTLAVNPYWASSLETVGVIGFHIFYRWPGNAGRPSAFTANYTGGEPSAQRARETTPDAPAPDAPLDMTQFAPPAAAAGQPVRPQNASPGQAGQNREQSDTASTDPLPGSGTVREEYANSGRWLDRP